jgi:hypothetical protein
MKRPWLASCTLLCLLSLPSFAGEAPAWLHTLAAAPQSSYDEKTEAVMLLSEQSVTVYSTDKVHTHVREAYRILRPAGKRYGTVVVDFNSRSKVSGLRAWCIPAEGKDYEVTEKAGAEIALPEIDGSELISDVRAKILEIPAADPGNVIGFEYDEDERPIFLQQEWSFQQHIPVREARLSLQLPAGWEQRVYWLNHAEVAPVQAGPQQWQWVLTDLPGLRHENAMPAWHGIAGEAVVSLFAPGGGANFSDWQGMGKWYQQLIAGTREPSPEIKQKVAALTAGVSSPVQRAKLLSEFVQHDIRYVAIELGIGGILPHPAPDIFRNHYGDCKDKVTLLASMLHEAGIDSFYVLVNSERGAVTPQMPAHNAFDHAIIAIRLPDGALGWPNPATINHPKLGRLLIFDPTDEVTPFGVVRGDLQGSYGLLVAGEGGELTAIPQLPSGSNTINRTGKFQLASDGLLTGEIVEARTGDRAANERWNLRVIKGDSDRIKRIEGLLSDSLSNFRITKASISNRELVDLPFRWEYSFISERYAKSAGSLIMFRPRVLGHKAMAIDPKEPRRFAFEFDGPALDTDSFVFTVPEAYVVDELPDPVNVDYSFASYHSRTVVEGNSITYKRSYEIREVSVPVAKLEELKRFFRVISGDERNVVVLRPR